MILVYFLGELVTLYKDAVKQPFYFLKIDLKTEDEEKYFLNDTENKSESDSDEETELKKM